MDCLEIISVRIAENESFEDAMRFCRAVVSPENNGDQTELKIYRHAEYVTDISIHINWINSAKRGEKSLLGLQIAKGLRDFGIVSHSAWIDQTKALQGHGVRKA